MTASAPPRLAFYGDDLTGSTDMLDALWAGGWRARLFLDASAAPAADAVAGLDAVGFAGVSRAMPPAWMDENLPAVFAVMKGLGAPLAVYKVCSTFDSAPHVGSIGRVLEIGAAVFGEPVPIVVGVPRNARYTAFGQLFAADQAGTVHRIDRHPVMARHPTTPMHEADLLRHLAAQTHLPLALVDLVAIGRGALAEGFAAAAGHGAAGILLDNLDARTSSAIGAFLHRRSETRTVFAIGSSGIAYALAPERSMTAPAVAPVARMLVLSGSASSATAAQIEAAERAGFAIVDVDPAALAAGHGEAEAVAAAGLHLAAGRSVVVATARGPQDPRLAAGAAALAATGLGSADALGSALGRIGRALLGRRHLVERIVLAGGDSSGFAARAMGVGAVDMIAPSLPGSPLCRVRSADPAVDGAELVFKGGQVGSREAFSSVRTGTAEPPAAAVRTGVFGMGGAA